MNLVSKNSRWAYSSDILNFLPDFIINILIEYILINSKKQELQKQFFTDFHQNNCSLKFSNIYRKTPGLESLFNKVAGLEARKSIKRRLQDKCFPVNIAKFLKTVFSIEHIWWLLPSGIETFFQFVIHATLKFLKIVWNKHNLMISSLVGSGHPGKYSYEVPHEYL